MWHYTSVELWLHAFHLRKFEVSGCREILVGNIGEICQWHVAVWSLTT